MASLLHSNVSVVSLSIMLWSKHSKPFCQDITSMLSPVLLELIIDMYHNYGFTLHVYSITHKVNYRQTSNVRRPLVGNIIVWSLKWSPLCSWSTACRHCSNHISMLDLTPGSNRLGRDNCKTRQATYTCWDLVPYTRRLTAYLMNFCVYRLYIKLL